MGRPKKKGCFLVFQFFLVSLDRTNPNNSSQVPKNLGIREIGAATIMFVSGVFALDLF